MQAAFLFCITSYEVMLHRLTQECHREPKLDGYGEREKTDAPCVEDKQIPFYMTPALSYLLRINILFLG